MRRRLLRASHLTLCAILAGPLAAGAQQQPRPVAAPVRVNFVGAPLADVIRSLATTLGITVLLADVPDRRVTFSTPGPVRPDEVGQILESILETNALVL